MYCMYTHASSLPKKKARICFILGNKAFHVISISKYIQFIQQFQKSQKLSSSYWAKATRASPTGMVKSGTASTIKWFVVGTRRGVVGVVPSRRVLVAVEVAGLEVFLHGAVTLLVGYCCCCCCTIIRRQSCKESYLTCLAWSDWMGSGGVNKSLTTSINCACCSSFSSYCSFNHWRHRAMYLHELGLSNGCNNRKIENNYYI